MANRFFNDLLSQGPDVKIPHALRVFWDGDTYPSLPGNIKLLDQIVRIRPHLCLRL